MHIKAYGDTSSESEDPNSEQEPEEGKKDIKNDELTDSEDEPHNDNNDNEDNEEDNEEDSEEDSDDSDESPMGFINLLDGRKSDDKLKLLLEKVPFFKTREHEDLREFLNDIIDMKYETVEDAFIVLKELNKKYNNN